MKKILITAGPVPGRLDDMKIVSNRARGIWALRLAEFARSRGHEVHLMTSTLLHTETQKFVGTGVRVTEFQDYNKYAAFCQRLWMPQSWLPLW